MRCEKYRDGGTLQVGDIGAAFYIDHRMGTNTPFAVYKNYPKAGMEPVTGTMIDDAREHLYEALENCDPFYESMILQAIGWCDKVVIE